MSPRRNHPRRRGGEVAPLVLDDQAVRRGVQSVQAHPDGEWLVRSVPGDAAGKIYRCPGCDHEIAPGTPHLVAWPADERGDLGDRRHWHTGCWRARDRRSPTRRRR